MYWGSQFGPPPPQKREKTFFKWGCNNRWLKMIIESWGEVSFVIFLPPPLVIMSSFVIFWLTPPSPSGDDVIYEQPLSKYTVFHQIHNINALLSQNVFVSIYALFSHNFSVSKSISPPICSLFGCTAVPLSVRQWLADVRKTFSPETFRPEKNAKN